MRTTMFVLAIFFALTLNGQVIQTQHFNYDVDYDLENPCTGETIHLTGEQHSVIKNWLLWMPPPPTTMLFSNTHMNLDGVGLTSGDTYKCIGVSVYKFKANVGSVEIWNEHVKIKNLDTGDEWTFEIHDKILIHPNGDIDFDIEGYSISCN